MSFRPWSICVSTPGWIRIGSAFWATAGEELFPCRSLWKLSVKAVVAYYALGDFEEWLDVKRYSFPKSLLFKWVRARIIKETGEPTEEKAQIRFRKTSPINFAGRMAAPVLLIHGEKDRNPSRSSKFKGSAKP